MPVAALALSVVAVASAVSGLDPFVTPSGHVACMYEHVSGEKPLLRCDVDHVAHPVKRPKACEVDYGSAFGLTASGRARRLCVGDTVRDPRAKVLAYGKTKHYGLFTCTSRKSGLRCTTGGGQHGFELSRERQKLF